MIRLGDIVQMVGGQLHGPESTVITGAAPLQSAAAGDISFVAERKLVPLALESKASCLIVQKQWATAVIDGFIGAVITVDNARLAFSRVLATFKPEDPQPIGIHPTAVIADDATIGMDVSIGPNVVIGAGATIGNRVKIGPTTVVGPYASIGDDSLLHASVTVADRVKIGRRVILQSGCVIGADGFGYVSTREAHVKVPHIGRVIIEDDVEIGANTTIDRATAGETVIGRGTKIDNLVMIAHNVQIGEQCLIVAMVGVSGGTTVSDRVTLAGKSGAVGHIHIGEGSIIAAGSIVTRDVAPGSHLSGIPARPHKQHLRTLAATQKLPEHLHDATELARLVEDLEQRIERLEGAVDRKRDKDGEKR